MSDYFHLVCNEHRAVSDVVATNKAWQGDEDGRLAAFVLTHSRCSPVLVSEYDPRVDQYASSSHSSSEVPDGS